LELDEELQGRLIWLRFQTLKHLRPVSFEEVGTAATRLVGQAAVFESVNYHTPGARS
jgi:hypothetical protein